MGINSFCHFFTTEFGILNKLIGNSLIRLIFICLNSFFCKVRCLVDSSSASIYHSSDAAKVVGHVEHRSAWGQSAATECDAFQCQRTGSASCTPSVHERPPIYKSLTASVQCTDLSAVCKIRIIGVVLLILSGKTAKTRLNYSKMNEISEFSFISRSRESI